ncbi:MAG: glucosaminidase domain-containing protein [Saprospiraceae bacterium]|nr:glucosaminidase domain-containing protein [Saprospiraceae bacterium]
MHSYLLKTVLILVCLASVASKPMKPEEGYIEQYKAIAIREMNRTGIPASIKMAQGIMESMSGRSELAVNANNHFGIKCKPGWDGDTYQYKDDDFDVKGELVHSCFRKYSAAEQSYLDHSEFLLNRKRYKVLFEYGKTDYVSWAKGLQACGYATDPNYAIKLIEAIERYKLYRFDQENELDSSVSKKVISETKYLLPKRPVETILIKNQNSKSTMIETHSRNYSLELSKKKIQKKKPNKIRRKLSKKH